MSHYNLVHKFIPMPHKRWKFQMQNDAVDKEWKTLETIPAWQLEKVKSKKDVILEAPTLTDTCHQSFKLTTCWNLAKLVKILPGIIVRRHHADRKQMRLLREQCAEWKKVPLQYCCNHVWMKNGGQIPWNAKPICETFKTSYLMGRPIRETFWATIWRIDYSIWFIGRVSSYLCERPVKNPSIWKESLTCIVPRIRIVRGVNLEGWHNGCRHWGAGNDGRIWNLLKKRLNAKEAIFPKQNGKFIFPVADGRIKPLGGDQELRTSTLIRDHPIRGEGHRNFLGESEGSLPPPQDTLPDSGEAIHDFWSFQETSSTAITLSPESNFTRREKNHSLFHWNTLTSPELRRQTWMSSKKATSMIIGIPMDQKICLVLGQTRCVPTYRNGCKNSGRISWMIEFLNAETHTPVLLMNPL